MDPHHAPATPKLRIGHGYDLHRLDPAGRPLLIASLGFEHDRGPMSHSDGDALLHAITDAILGALGEPDIGQLFPDNAAENESRASREFLREALRRMKAAGYGIVNLDATLILERPKIGPRKTELIDTLASLMEIDRTRVNLKAKTHEKVDAVGEGRAIEAHAVVLLHGD